MKFSFLATCMLVVALGCVNVFGQQTGADKYQHFIALTRSAPHAFTRGDLDLAASQAKELLKLAPNYKQDFNYSNAMHAAHVVFGRVAFAQGNISEAKKQLLQSVDESVLRAETPGGSARFKGSPHLDSFGPDMSLAQDLLSQGEKETVLQYLELCRKFWRMDFDKLDKWKAQIERDEKPNFGPNLVYIFGRMESSQ